MQLSSPQAAACSAHGETRPLMPAPPSPAVTLSSPPLSPKRVFIAARETPSAPLHGSACSKSPSWTPQPSLPPHTLALVLHAFLSFVICSMDRINLSVAIIPMAAEHAWSPAQQGLIQAVFFLGYMTTQIVGGRLADRLGGRRVLVVGVAIWSLCTGLIPPAAAASTALLLAVRVVLGAGEGVAMPAMNAMIAASVAQHFRARALSFVYSGMYAGSILGLLLSPPIIAAMGYRALFYIFAIVGIAWTVVFLLTTREEAPLGGGRQLVDVELGEDTKSPAPLLPELDAVPPPRLAEIFARRPVWAIIVAHFCCTWGYFVLLAWLPTYFYARFSLNLSESAFLSMLPWFAMFAFANVGGVLADGMLAHGYRTTTVRKTMQAIGFLGPAAFLVLVATAQSVKWAVPFVTAALACSAFSQSGVYANHQDIGPHIAGTLLGISNTFASIPGLVGVYVTGVVLEVTGNRWEAVFGMAIFFYLVGFVVYTAFATSEQIWGVER